MVESAQARERVIRRWNRGHSYGKIAVDTGYSLMFVIQTVAEHKEQKEETDNG